ncbi:MAG: hypothetical protein Q7K44_03765 [Candidatus Liptonbacteria bacterium]|nr:hypothetical protein [Candidatus Liptonbacteria bacterium]
MLSLGLFFAGKQKEKRKKEMHKERFSEILGEHGFSKERIDTLWGYFRVPLDEEIVQNVARLLAPINTEIV